MATGTTLDVMAFLEPVPMATEIARRYQEWVTFRLRWVQEKKELRNYLYATDTSTTSNARLPWANSTTTPKLTQIYDNLKANYEAALFPNSEWMRWEAKTVDDADRAKAAAIQGYLYSKFREDNFRTTADRLIDDFILYGNCFAAVEWVSESAVGENGVVNMGYTGPRLVRISPYDICFNPTAPSFKTSPKIVRSLVQIGDLVKMDMDGEVLDRMYTNRREVAGATNVDKSEAFIADGFSSIEHYYKSGYVEILTFYGDLYSEYDKELRENRKITIADRAYIVSDEPIPTWLGDAPIFHAGWRSRPDNLYAMGPLDNLVGMQYRMDHLENLKADVFDQIALPMLKVKGDVEDFEYQPGERIILGEDGDVGYLVPDTTAMQADFQINQLQVQMEEMAGAPRNAMGIRTPGEKTAFEVSQLQNAAGRIFQHKAAKLEIEFFEPIYNAMIEAAKRNMNTVESIRVPDPATGSNIFRNIQKEDLLVNGRIVPVGARHYAERAQRVQNINQLLQFKQMPDVGPHISGKKIAELIAYELGESELFSPNVAVRESMETQQAAQDQEASNLEQLQIAQEEGL
jgi:hypothetical protein